MYKHLPPADHLDDIFDLPQAAVRKTMLGLDGLESKVGDNGSIVTTYEIEVLRSMLLDISDEIDAAYGFVQERSGPTAAE